MKLQRHDDVAVQIRARLGNFADLVFLAGWGIAWLAMLALGIVGMLEIFEGLRTVVDGLSAQRVKLGSVLEGFEYLLLAPIPLVVVVTIGNYIRQFLRLRPRDEDTKIGHAEAEHQFHSVKQLILSLMISVVATDLVKRFLEDDLLKAEYGGVIRGVVFGGALFVLLTVYLLVRFVWLDRRD